MYCSLEVAQEFPDPTDGIPMICEKSHEKAYDQVCGYMDRLGVNEGWLVVFDSDLSKPWEEKIYTKDLPWNGKTVRLVGC